MYNSDTSVHSLLFPDARRYGSHSPPRCDNGSDTLDGKDWNLTIFENWNYTYYSNGTVSNGSLCFLVFKPFTPFLLDNGTFLNSTSCYSPIEHLKIAFQNRTGIRISFRYKSYSRSLVCRNTESFLSQEN